MINCSNEHSITMNLLDSQISDHKKVVESDINGWLQTMKKEKKEKACFLIKLKPVAHLFNREIRQRQRQRQKQKQRQRQKERDTKKLSMVFEQNKQNQQTNNILKNYSMNLPTKKNNQLNIIKQHAYEQKSTVKSLKSAYILKELRRKKIQRNNLKLFQYNTNRYQIKIQLQNSKPNLYPLELYNQNQKYRHCQKRLSIKSCRQEIKKYNNI